MTDIDKDKTLKLLHLSVDKDPVHLQINSKNQSKFLRRLSKLKSLQLIKLTSLRSSLLNSNQKLSLNIRKKMDKAKMLSLSR